MHVNEGTEHRLQPSLLRRNLYLVQIRIAMEILGSGPFSFSYILPCQGNAIFIFNLGKFLKNFNCTLKYIKSLKFLFSYRV